MSRSTIIGVVAGFLLVSCGLLQAGDDNLPTSAVVVAPCSRTALVDVAIQFRNDDGFVDPAAAICGLDELPDVGDSWWQESDHWWIVFEEGAGNGLTRSTIVDLAANGLDFELRGSFCSDALELWERLPSTYEVRPEARQVIDEVVRDFEQSAVDC